MSTYDDRGWVAPMAGDGSGMEPIEPTQRPIRSSVLGGVILVAVIAAAIAATVMWRGRNGDPYASAHSVPADMDFVVTFDALALSDSAQLQNLVDAFAVPMVDAGIIDDYPDDLVAAIDESLAAESDFTLSADILPWIGRSVSLAASIPELNQQTYEIDGISFLLSADVRDSEAANAFVDKIVFELSQEGVEPTSSTIGGLPGLEWRDENDDLSIGLVVTDDTLLVGTEQDVADAIAANDAGLSIADDATFVNVMQHLPDERMVSFYMGKNALDGFLDLAAMSSPLGLVQAQPQGDLFDGMGAAVSLVDQGVRVSYAVAGGDQAQSVIAPDRNVVEALPEDTLAFLSAAGSGAGDSAAAGEALDNIGGMLDPMLYGTGIDAAAVLGSLSGDFTVAVAETSDGAIAAESEVPIGLVAALGLVDSGPVTDLLTTLEQSLAPPSISFDENDGVTTVSENGAEIVSYSVDPNLFVIGSGQQLVSGVLAGGDGGPTDTALYRELDDAIIGDGLVGYADIPAIVDLVPLTREEAAVVAPVRGVGIGGDTDGTIQTMEFLILVDY